MGFDESPLLVIWETTRAGEPICVHCRPPAAPRRQSLELSTEEAHRLLETVREFDNPLMVFTGGDPLRRPDLSALLDRSKALGLRTCVSPNATPLLTKEAVHELRKCAVARMSIELDGPNADTHDASCGAPGTFDLATAALREARSIGLDTEIRTTVTRRNWRLLDRIAGLAGSLGISEWSVSFSVDVGPTTAEEDITADEYEEVFEKLYNFSLAAPFAVNTSDAAHYRRYVARRLHERAEPADPRRALWQTVRAGEGRGSVFISYSGEIYPSGFLPISAGNVRYDSLVEVYRTSPLFLELRDPDARHGKCGFCEYRKLCGGSLARAWALTGDYLGAWTRAAATGLARKP